MIEMGVADIFCARTRAFRGTLCKTEDYCPGKPKYCLMDRGMLNAVSLKNKWGGFFLVLRGIFGKSFCVFLPFPFPAGSPQPA
jgi:hypothetical protein